MADKFTVTGITRGEARQPDGSYVPTVEVHYVTKTTPPIAGVVSMPADAMRDVARYKAAVAEAIHKEVAAHEAVLSL